MYEEWKPFGISVCCVEPGATRTEFLSNRAEGGDHRIKTAKQLDVYQGTTAASMREATDAYNGKQPGDVDRCAKAIVDVLTREGLSKGKEIPMRLALGSDCLATVRAKCESTLKLVEEWEEVTAYVDGEGAKH